MTRVETLREQASVLRTLAESFDDKVIRGDLLRVAERCEDIADKILEALQREASRRKGDPTDPRLMPRADRSTR